MLRSFSLAGHRMNTAVRSSTTIQFSTQRKPSNKKKKRKERRKRLKTIEKEARAIYTKQETRRLRLLRLGKLHDAAKWKRLLAMGDETWFTRENMMEHGQMRQYMLRCDGWCPVSVLQSLYINELEYWTTTRTLALAFNCELAGDRYSVQTDQVLWEDCNRQYKEDFVDPLDDDRSDEDYPSTLLDVIEDYKGVSVYDDENKADLDNLEPKTKTRDEALDNRAGEGEIERMPVDLYEADDDLEYDWEYMDEEDYRMLEESYDDDDEGIVAEDFVDAKYRFAMVRHKDLSLHFLQGIEDENKRRFETIMTNHSYLYDEEAPKFGWYRNVPAYDSGLVLSPKPTGDVADKLQALLRSKRRA